MLAGRDVEIREHGTVRLAYGPGVGRLFDRLSRPGWIGAMTLGRVVLARDAEIGERDVGSRLHVRAGRRRWARCSCRHMASHRCRRCGRDAYLDNRYEVEARRYESWPAMGRRDMNGAGTEPGAVARTSRDGCCGQGLHPPLAVRMDLRESLQHAGHMADLAEDPTRMNLIDSLWLDVKQTEGPVAVGAVLEFEGRTVDRQDPRARRRDARTCPRLRQKPEHSRTGILQGKWVDDNPDLEQHVTKRKIAKGPGGGDLQSCSSRRWIPIARSWDISVLTGTRRTVGLCGACTMLWPTARGDHAGRADHRHESRRHGDHDGCARRPADAARAARCGPVDVTPTRATSCGPLWSERSRTQLPSRLRRRRRSGRCCGWPQRRRPNSRGRPRRDAIGVTSICHSAVKAAGKQNGATVNDVIMAAVTNGYRKVLLSHGEDLEGREVRAVMPVSRRTPGIPARTTRSAPCRSQFPVGIGDPQKRLKRVVRADPAGEEVAGTRGVGFDAVTWRPRSRLRRCRSSSSRTVAGQLPGSPTPW